MSDHFAALTRGYDRLASHKNSIFMYNQGVANTTTKANIFALESAGGKFGIVDSRSGLLQVFPSLSKTLSTLTEREGDPAVKNSVGKLKGQQNTPALWTQIREQDPSKQVTDTIGERELSGVKVGSDTLFRLV